MVLWERCVHQPPPRERPETRGFQIIPGLNYEKQKFLHFLCIKTHHPAWLAGGGVGVTSQKRKCAHMMAAHLLVMRAVPDRSARRSWSVAFRLRGRT